MNRIILTIILFGCSFLVSAQTILTPNGTTVHVTRLEEEEEETVTPYEKSLWSQEFDSVYTRATEVGTLSSTAFYNCHGYAWWMTSGHSDDELNILGASADTFWLDLSYIEVPVGFAQKVRYTSPRHSGVMKSDTTVRSKFDNHVLADHPIDYLPYYDTTGSATWIYYARQMQILEELEYYTTIYASGTPYKVSNTDYQNQPGIQFLWSAGQNVTIISGGNSASCTFGLTYRFPNESDSSSISVQLTRNGDTKTLTKTVSLGPAPDLLISGPTLLCSTGGSYSISYVPDDATITWIPGPNVSIVSGQGTSSCTFMSTGGSSSYIKAQLFRNGYDDIFTYPIWSGPPESPEITASNVSGGYGNYTTTINSGTAYFSMGSSAVNPFWDVSNATSSTSYPYNYYLDVYPNVAGENYITAYRDNSCGTSNGGFVYLEVTAGRAAMEEDSLSISLSPNPASQFVDIELVTWGELIVDSDYVIEFVDAYSRVVKQVTLSGTLNRVNIQDLQKGYYVVILRYGKRISSAILLVK